MNTLASLQKELPKILIVDDNDKNLFAMKTILHSLAANLVTATCGNDALALILRHQFCLILLDVQMPDMDGFELAELIRENEGTKHIPIIFLTALSKEDCHIIRGYNLGAVDYLLKPVNPTILKSKVHVFLELRQKRDLEELVKELEAAHKELKNSVHLMIQNEKMSTLGQFAAGIAHELNNPMMGILNFVQYCRTHTQQEDKRFKVLTEAEHEIKRCADILKNLLSFSHQDHDKPESRNLVSIEELFDRVISLLAYRIRQHNIAISAVIESNLSLRTHSNSLMQVLINIVSNAIDALETAPLRNIELSAEIKNDRIFIQIKDSGVGIPQDNLSKIFEFFFTTKPPNKGTGLGLPICKKIIENLEGELSCESLPGRGTTFTILLPMNTKTNQQELDNEQSYFSN
ncbi:Sporulation kinase A [Legionella massiliensis]|uniref:histidine kinase n=1 Tax=Legionella massiliensis TaxID=1034943 RepID=A0A078KYK1_9GAMM|nr:hybrid sensor histidine kinase/response regulator [Legionella massiliensis]CDZ76854.1 Sporulation kinase A [Legionella massiliensis]CEE12592.1 Sporulation kinase A [Legionella massiliensis]